jgi:hypothetical protein
MFTVDTVVDAVQTGKKAWVKTFITNDHIADALNSFIDNQSEYTKKALKATVDAGTVVAQETVKAIQDTAKFDYVKFGEGIMKAYNATSKK